MPTDAPHGTAFLLHEQVKTAADDFFASEKTLVEALEAFASSLLGESDWQASRIVADARQLAAYIELDGDDCQFEFSNVARDLHELGVSFSVWNDRYGYDAEGSVKPHVLTTGFGHLERERIDMRNELLERCGQVERALAGALKLGEAGDVDGARAIHDLCAAQIARVKNERSQL